MSNTIRINTTPNGSDKYLKLKLDQDFDFIKILSLRISQEDAYRKFCSDYGTIVGRVIINSGFGVPNAKVSVFIPIDDVDKNNPLIKGLYPFEVISDKDSDGIRYNLLPKESETNNDCFTPIGTFPTKREVLDNDTMLNIYCKYYKFTTTTNHAGDFMIFGVPIGTYTVHVDADISDIGEASQRPYDLIRQGTPEKLFDSSTKFKSGTNLDKLVQVKSANVGVNVQPFWGDTENCEIGISRVDIDLNYNIVPAAIFMGSIFGDQHKHSINKRCRPRRALGELCQQITNSGSVEIIRKTIDNQIEEFSVEGGRVIDDDGTWAFQIPMNLDYMVTAEDGSLILSQDPNIGIPTRTSVRFRISMDESGSEGRLRTRAKYLVPNNPQTASEIDYEFGPNTKDTSFKDLYWNKIYSVSNFITRYERNIPLIPISRNMTAIKDVDACVGTKTPFPFNRVQTETNPIFFVICLILQIVAFIVYLINRIVGVINSIINAINSFGFGISNVPCLVLPCVTDEGTTYYAPGCGDSGGINKASPRPSRYCGDNYGDTCDFGNDVGWVSCVSFELAKTLGLFQFDFFNDWVNGSLFSYLLKYKKKRNGKEKFCEYDCSDFVNDPNYSGVDGNNDGNPDNECFNERLVDTLFDNVIHDGCQKEYKTYEGVRDGLIKKYNGNLYYSSTLHRDNVSIKLFATDIIFLGSVFDCDWQGLPKIQQYLIPTTYKIPPDIPLSDNNNVNIIESGMISNNTSVPGLIFNVDCNGLRVNDTQAMNVRHLCEIGVDLDELIEDPLTSTVIYAPDGVIGSHDITGSTANGDINKEIRDVFLALNSGTTFPTLPLNLSNGLSSNFNETNTRGFYDFANVITTNGTGSFANNGIDYVNFRGLNTSTEYDQPKHSFYFYFGLIPGRSSLEKMNQKYFIACNPPVRNDIIIESTVTPDLTNLSSGSISFTIVGGHGPYTYSVIGSNGYINSRIVSADPLNPNASQTVTLSNLSVGQYVITATDTSGNPVSLTIIVSGPTPFYCSVYVKSECTSAIANDGVISIITGGGGPTKTFTVTDHNGAPVGTNPSGTILHQPQLITGLPTDTANGYIVTVSDGINPPCVTSGLKVGNPTSLVASLSSTPETCKNTFDGTIIVDINGGIAPYQINITGPNNPLGAINQNSPATIYNLSTGTYNVTVIDSNMRTLQVGTITVGSLSDFDFNVTVINTTNPNVPYLYEIRTIPPSSSLHNPIVWTPPLAPINPILGLSSLIISGTTSSILITGEDSLGCKVSRRT